MHEEVQAVLMEGRLIVGLVGDHVSLNIDFLIAPFSELVRAGGVIIPGDMPRRATLGPCSKEIGTVDQIPAYILDGRVLVCLVHDDVPDTTPLMLARLSTFQERGLLQIPPEVARQARLPGNMMRKIFVESETADG